MVLGCAPHAIWLGNDLQRLGEDTARSGAAHEVAAALICHGHQADAENNLI